MEYVYTTQVATIAVFGGSFNPPHLAHVLAATVVLATHDIDTLLVVPTFQHPFSKHLAPYDDRVHMSHLAMGWLPRVEVSRVEEQLGGESLTLRTLEHLARQHPDWQLRLVLGADVLADAPKWHRFDEVMRLAPPIILGRAGVEAPGAPVPVLPELSSTEVRASIAAGEWANLAGRVPKAVLSHIQARGLYGAA